MTAQPRLVVSAPSSGHGKTAIAVGLLAACAARGVVASGFKVGPDHTDAAYLGLASGRPGRNLDPRLVGAQRIAPLFGHGAAGSQVAVIEGAMGLFDSLTGQPEIDGTAAVAATLRAPVALVVDVASMGHSVAALVHGFRMFDEMVHLGGVILNRVASPRHEQLLRSALDDIGMPVLGALRRGDLPSVLPPRSQGPVPVAHQAVDASRAVRRLGEAVAEALDLDRLIALANAAPPLPGPLWSPAEAVGAPSEGERPVIAVAGGTGATYTYVEVAELLTAAGADVAVFDPLRDETLPPGVRGLMIGAGLPEGYAEELSANRRLCSAVARLAHDGAPVIAEGVGLPWLTRDFDGRPMCGVLDASAVTGDRTVAGYREATAPVTSPLAPAGARITGYKQHRAIVSPRAGQAPAWTWAGGNPEGFVYQQVHASQLGLHWAGAPEIARRLVAAAAAYRGGGTGPGGGGPGAGPVVSGTVVGGPVVTGTVVAGQAPVGQASVGSASAGSGSVGSGSVGSGSVGSGSVGSGSVGSGSVGSGSLGAASAGAASAGPVMAGPAVTGPVLTGSVVSGSVVTGSVVGGGPASAGSPAGGRPGPQDATNAPVGVAHEAGVTGFAAGSPRRARAAGVWDAGSSVPGREADVWQSPPGDQDAGRPRRAPDADDAVNWPADGRESRSGRYPADPLGQTFSSGPAASVADLPGYERDGAPRGHAHAGGPWDGGPGDFPMPGAEGPPGGGPAVASPAAGYSATSPAVGYSAASPAAGYVTGEPEAGYSGASPAAGYAPREPEAGYSGASPAAGYAPREPEAGYVTGEPEAGYSGASPAAGYAPREPGAGYVTGESSAGHAAAAPTAGYAAVAPPTPRSAPAPAPGGPLAAVGAGQHDTENDGDGDTADVVPRP